MSTVRFFRHSTQLFRHYIPTEYLLLGIIEFLLLIFALYAGLELRFLGSGWPLDFGSFFPKALLYAIVMQMSLVALGVYQRQSGRFVEVILLRVGAGLLLGLIPLAMSFYFAPMFFLGRGVLALAVIFSFILILGVRLYFRRIVKERNMWSRVLVLGSGEAANLIRESVKAGDLTGINIIGYITMPGDRQQEIEFDRIALDGSLIKYVEKKHIDEIVLAVDDRRAGLPARELLECRMSGVDVLDLVTFFERRTGKIRMDILNPSWLYLSDGFRECVFRKLGKRGIDIVVVLLLLPITLPVMLLIAFAILVESKGREPILYQQVRVKQDGELFEIYKFRSMVADAERDGKVRWASRNDSRITSVGWVLRKGRLDELPQLFNILKGDMSFVGPRPERPEFVTELSNAIPYYDERHRVKPGLTGWAQICYPYGESEEDAQKKLQYDLYYVKNYSIFLDLLILLQTAEVVLLGKGAQ
ncbi:MAG: TIGR03013 family PEP-CTERM/XrtA system glycosyltransferase [Gammaproteobacteria bacterium]|nr:MAG: TIGR03013 family PEP-CTERM/XrtA system glycosyltransferase [Gammaproteobacteria bacterium]